MTDWLQKWPREYHEILKAMRDKLNLQALYLDKEVSGKSGARTFFAKTQGLQGIGNKVVLKFGTSDIIDQDVEGHNTARVHFRLIPPRWEVVSNGGVKCLSVEVVLDGHGKTLRESFDAMALTDISASIELLFTDAIKLNNLNVKKTALKPFELYTLRDTNFAARLRSAGDEPYTLWDWWQRAVEKCKFRGIVCLIHGDLHGGNILVSDNEIRLIDFGLLGEGHAPRDLAKLERDICLFVDGVSAIDAKNRMESIYRFLEDEDGLSSASMSIQRAVIGVKALRLMAKKWLGNYDDWDFQYNVALMAQYMFAAVSNESPEIREASISKARSLRKYLESLDKSLAPSPNDIQLRELEDRAWRFAYAFLRLDQLPGGAWARTLPGWMDAIWEGEHGTVFRSPEMKANGGVDSTGYAVSLLTKFWRSVFLETSNTPPIMLIDFLQNNLVFQNCVANIDGRVSDAGAIDPGAVGRGKTPKIKLRHSIMGLLLLLNIKDLNETLSVDNVTVRRLQGYILKNLSNWEADESHQFGMYAAGSALLSLEQHRSPNSDLCNALEKALGEIGEKLLQKSSYNPQPAGSYNTDGKVTRSFFTPYYDFWRMERSNAFMFLPFLTDRLSDSKPSQLKMAAIGYPLAQILSNEFPEKESGLVPYFKAGNEIGARDWGLTAELLVLLENPAISQLLSDCRFENKKLVKLREHIRKGLFSTLADCSGQSECFKYSHGLSCGAFINTSVKSRICPEHLIELDKEITLAQEEKCSEAALYRLAAFIFGVKVTQEGKVEISEAIKKDVLSMTELFVSKLVAGEHVKEHWTEDSHDHTVAFFDSKDVGSYIARYRNDHVHSTLLTRLGDVFGTDNANRAKALDLGSGLGDGALELFNLGYHHVYLVDASEVMNKYAVKRLEEWRDQSHNLDCHFEAIHGDAKKLSDVKGPNLLYFESNQFDLITANALMVHIAPKDAAKVFKQIYRLLKPGGHFLVNFKLGDHTLNSLDGRYFAYYKNVDIPGTMIRNTGFKIHEIALRWNDRTLYNVLKPIQWANFYCSRPSGS